MIEVNRIEKERIQAECPNAHIVKTMRQHSGRGHYYCEESRKVLRLLREMREGGVHGA